MRMASCHLGNVDPVLSITVGFLILLHTYSISILYYAHELINEVNRGSIEITRPHNFNAKKRIFVTSIRDDR